MFPRMEWNSGQVWNPNGRASGKPHMHPGFLLGSVFKTKVPGSKRQQRVEQKKQIRIWAGGRGGLPRQLEFGGQGTEEKRREQRKDFRNLQSVPLESCLNTGAKLCSHRIRLFEAWQKTTTGDWGEGGCASELDRNSGGHAALGDLRSFNLPEWRVKGPCWTPWTLTWDHKKATLQELGYPSLE